MADIKIAGVMRAGAYSPNHIGNDAAIFNAAAEKSTFIAKINSRLPTLRSL